MKLCQIHKNLRMIITALHLSMTLILLFAELSSIMDVSDNEQKGQISTHHIFHFDENRILSVKSWHPISAGIFNSCIFVTYLFIAFLFLRIAIPPK